MRLPFGGMVRINYRRNIAPIAIWARHGDDTFSWDL